MVTTADTDLQARLDALRSLLEDVSDRVWSHQRRVDDLTNYALRRRDVVVPEAIARWNESPSLRQATDGRLGGAMPALAVQIGDQSLKVDSTQVTVRGGTVTLSGTNVVLRGEPIELSASPIRIHASRVTIAGTLRCDTIRSNSFVTKVYQVGAGNIW